VGRPSDKAIRKSGLQPVHSGGVVSSALPAGAGLLALDRMLEGTGLGLQGKQEQQQEPPEQP
jgi:hypothetical protein